MQNISTVILTKNEEKTIERSLKSVIALSDDVIVVDCFSEDKTVEIARQYTDKVFLNDWPGFSEQRKFGLSKTINDWILWIDADEEISPALAEEIRSLDFAADGYAIPILVNYLGRWIRHCGWYPDYKMRLFNKQKGQFNDVMVHESFSVQGKIQRLKAPIHHYSYRDISHHIEKMNNYTSLAALQMKQKGKKVSILSALGHSVSRFFKMYLLKLGCLDGKQGIIISVLGSYYVFLKYIKRWESSQIEDDAASPPKSELPS